MKRFVASGLAALLVGLAVARADDPPAQPQPRKPAAPSELSEKLANGLEVVVLPSAKAKQVAVVTAWRTGARDEQASEAGTAQLVARLLRKAACGTREAGAADAELAALGPKNSGPQASTGSDSVHALTWTWATVPEDKVGLVLEIERDRLTALKPTAAVLDEARQGIMTELVKRETRAVNALVALAFPDSALGRPRNGSGETVSSLKLETVEAWRKAHLRIDAGVLVIAGVKDGKAALALVKEKLGSIAKPEGALPVTEAPKAAPKGPLRSSLDGPQMARHVWLAFRGPDAGTDDEAAFLAAVFALKDKVEAGLQGKAREVTVRADARSDSPALLVISASPRPSTPLLDVEARARGAANAVRSEAPGDLDRLKGRVEHLLDGFTSPLDQEIQGAKDEAGAVLEAAVDRALAQPLVLRRETLKKSLRALTGETFLAKAKVLLSEDRMSIVTIEPAGK